MRSRALALVLALCASAATGAEFRSVNEASAILYDAPSTAAVPVFLVTRGYPLEIVSTTEAWLKVKDHAGALNWIERKAVSAKRTVVVTSARAEAHERPEDSAPVAFAAAQSVVLDLIEIAPGGWLRVRHADGATGYMRASQLWGD